MSRLLLVAVGVAGLVACSPDSDKDGLSNKAEAAAGTDPKVADSDADGLLDGQEITLGTNPLLADTDGDGLSDGDEVNTYKSDPLVVDTDGDSYSDGAEVAAGHDPNDAKDKIYTGNWPYNADKASINDPGISGTAKKGKNFGDVQFVDQFGDTVDLYDFAMHGKPIVVDISTQWCEWCQGAAKLIHGDTPSGNGYDAQCESALISYGYSNLADMVQNGDVYWVTILDEDNSGATATKQTVKEWSQAYPNDQVAVLADPTVDAVFNYADGVGFPTMLLLDENMKVKVAGDSTNGYPDVFDALEAEFGSQYPAN